MLTIESVKELNYPRKVTSNQELREAWKICINKIFAEWRGDSRKSVTQFAAEVARAPQQVVNDWLNHGRVPSPTYLANVGEKYPEAYRLFGMSVAEEGFLYSIPGEWRANFAEARAEYTIELLNKGIEKDSPEAREIIKEAFDRHGIKFTFT